MRTYLIIFPSPLLCQYLSFLKSGKDLPVQQLIPSLPLNDSPEKKGGKEQDITGKKGLYIEALGSRGMTFKVSAIFEGLIVPLSLITYIEGILEEDVSFS